MVSFAVLPMCSGSESLADEHVGAERHAFGFHLAHAAIDQPLLQLEVGNAITQQAADAVVLLEHRHVVPRARELLRGGQTSRAGSDHGDLLAGLVLRRQRRDPAFGPGFVDDRVFDRLDADRIVVDAERARRFARRRADAARELGEVVRRVQHFDRVLPVLMEHQVVEVRNDVVHRAAVVAERNAAVHAARALDLRFVVGQCRDEFLVVLHARERSFVRLVAALELEKTGCLAHVVLFLSVSGGVIYTRRANAERSTRRVRLNVTSAARPPVMRRALPCSPSSLPSRPARACIRSGTPSRTDGATHPSFRAAPSHAANP